MLLGFVGWGFFLVVDFLGFLLFCWFGFFKQFPVLSCLFIRVKLASQPFSVWHGTPKLDSSELLFKSVSLAMILDTVIFRLNKIWCGTLFFASQTHYMYTLIQLAESGEVRNEMKMKSEQGL